MSVEVSTHEPDVCAGRPCCIHSPSAHHMVGWHLHHRLDRVAYVNREPVGVLSERICPHGIGHPDPDSMAYLLSLGASESEGIHGCDGCCAP